MSSGNPSIRINQRFCYMLVKTSVKEEFHMPYQKDKQQAFQAAQQAVAEATQAVGNINSYPADMGAHIKRAEKELNEAEQQINKALTISSDHQHQQLEQYQQTIAELKQQLPTE